MWIFKSTVRDIGQSKCWIDSCVGFSYAEAQARQTEIGVEKLQAMVGRKERSAVAPSGAGPSTLSSAAATVIFPSPMCTEVWVLTCDLESSVQKDPVSCDLLETLCDR